MAKSSVTGVGMLLAVVVVLGIATVPSVLADGPKDFNNITPGDFLGRHLLAHGRSLTALKCTFPGPNMPCPGTYKGACCDTADPGGNCNYCVPEDGCTACSNALPYSACCGPSGSG